MLCNIYLEEDKKFDSFLDGAFERIIIGCLDDNIIGLVNKWQSKMKLRVCKLSRIVEVCEFITRRDKMQTKKNCH